MIEPIIVRARDWPRRLQQALIVVGVLVLLAAVLLFSGLIRYEHQRGFFAPAWGPEGRVYFIERETLGLHFDMPFADILSADSSSAHWSWVWDDQIRIRELNPATGEVRTLRTWQDTPVAGHFVRAPADYVFGLLMATLNTSGGLSFTVNVRVPEKPPYGSFDLQQQQMLFTGRSDNIIRQMHELMAVPGQAFYPAAIITTVNNQDYEVLLQNDKFKALYPDGIPATLLAELSRRASVKTQEQLLAKRAALIERYQRQGLNLTEATARANNALAADGYQVVEPRLLASRIENPAPDERVFSISAANLLNGYFSDIAAAIASPGIPVQKSAESYTESLTTGRELNQWLAEEHVSWVVASDGKYYRLLLLY